MSKNIKEITPNDKERFMPKINLSEIADYSSNIEGKILTVIEASITDQKQREAVKSLVRQSIWVSFDMVRDWFYSQSENNANNFPFNSVLPTTKGY